MPLTSPKTKGGARLNSGRKQGSSAYGETTKPIRVPESLLPGIKLLLDNRKQHFKQLANSSSAILLPAKTPSLCVLPLFSGKVAAGFPSPADDYVEKTLDLNELLVQKPAATFFVRAQGESMLGAGIHPNDILVVDRSIEAVPGKIVICALNGELTVKRLERENGQWQLKAENPAYPDIAIHEALELVIWGVVTNVIYSV
ncbi:MAG: LexA family protein [Methylobacter sp.]